MSPCALPLAHSSTLTALPPCVSWASCLCSLLYSDGLLWSWCTNRIKELVWTKMYPADIRERGHLGYNGLTKLWECEDGDTASCCLLKKRAEVKLQFGDAASFYVAKNEASVSEWHLAIPTLNPDYKRVQDLPFGIIQLLGLSRKSSIILLFSRKLLGFPFQF